MQDEAPKVRAEPSEDVRLARLLVRAIWQQEWNEANPNGTPKERAAAWKQVRAEQTTARGKIYRKALAQLKRAGVTFALPEGEAEGDEA